MNIDDVFNIMLCITWLLYVRESINKPRGYHIYTSHDFYMYGKAYTNHVDTLFTHHMTSICTGKHIQTKWIPYLHITWLLYVRESIYKSGGYHIYTSHDIYMYVKAYTNHVDTIFTHHMTSICKAKHIQITWIAYLHLYVYTWSSVFYWVITLFNDIVFVCYHVDCVVWFWSDVMCSPFLDIPVFLTHANMSQLTHSLLYLSSF